jgi:hypothetical protein
MAPKQKRNKVSNNTSTPPIPAPAPKAKAQAKRQANTAGKTFTQKVIVGHGGPLVEAHSTPALSSQDWYRHCVLAGPTYGWPRVRQVVVTVKSCGTGLITVTGGSVQETFFGSLAGHTSRVVIPNPDPDLVITITPQGVNDGPPPTFLADVVFHGYAAPKEVWRQWDAASQDDRVPAATPSRPTDFALGFFVKPRKTDG